MRALAAVLAFSLGSMAVAGETDGGVSDAPLAILVDEGSVVPHGTADTLQVGPGMYLNATSTLAVVNRIETITAERDALAKAFDEDEAKLQAKSNSPIIAAVIVGVICLGGGIALGMSLK